MVTTAMIDIHYETDDPKRRELVDRYFATNERGQFVENVTDIAADYGMTWKQVLAIVRSCCTALSSVHRCEVCDRRKEFTSRKDIRENRTMDTFTCARCRREQAQRVFSDASSDSSEDDRHLRRHVRSIAQTLSDVSDKLEGVSNELQLITASLEGSS